MSYRTQKYTWQRFLGFACLGMAYHISFALANDVVTDGTMGSGVHTLVGGNGTVPDTWGHVSGHNLFHSFSDFNVDNGNTATFTESVPNAYDNVISRVTGSNPSIIDGMLQSTMGHAAFYFINPNGITFGANAQIDVPGAFHVSTANKIDFQNNGGSLYADPDQVSTLSSEAPGSLGFLATNPANNGLIDINGAQLAVNPGNTLDVTAGGIAIENGATLTASVGEIRLVSMQGAGSVSVQPASDGTLPLPVVTPAANNAGIITIDNSIIDANGNGGGRIAIWGGSTAITNSAVVEVDNNGATDATSAKGVYILSDSMRVDNSAISSDAKGAGKVGDVTVHTRTLNILNDGTISSDSYGQGIAGNVSVTATTLKIDGQGSSSFTGISSDANDVSSGNAGNVIVNAGTLDVLNSGQISSDTYAQGNAGNVSVTATTLKIDGQGSSSFTGISSDANDVSSGNAGNVIVNAGTLDVLNSGQISSDTYAQGNAGNVSVTATTLKIDGQGNSSFTGISSDAIDVNSGNAGNVIVNAGTLDVLNSGQISSDTNAQGNAGTVTLHAGILNILNEGNISSSTFGQGSAGRLNIAVDKLTIDGQDAGLYSKSNGINSSGKTGGISVSASQWLHMANGGAISIKNDAFVSAENVATIHPGSITVTAPDIVMQDSTITSASTGNVTAGNITVNFSHWLTMDPSYISTAANTGNGGSIAINGGGLINLQNSGFMTSVNGANSNGGDITVTADELVMNTGIIQANAFGGNGGNITLNLGGLIPSGNTLLLGGQTVAWQPFVFGLNVIQAASQSGVSGSLSVTAPQLNLSGVLANMGGPQFDTSIISQDYCGLGSGSTLTRTGRGGLPPKGGDLQGY